MIKPVSANFETRLFKAIKDLKQEVKDLRAKREQKYLSLREAAEYLGISYRTAYRDWKSWIKYGVSPCKYNKFKKEDLDELMEMGGVIKKTRNRRISNALN